MNNEEGYQLYIIRGVADMTTSQCICQEALDPPELHLFLPGDLNKVRDSVSNLVATTGWTQKLPSVTKQQTLIFYSNYQTLKAEPTHGVGAVRQRQSFSVLTTTM